MPKFKFDASIYATFEIEAFNEEAARKVMQDTQDLLEPSRFAIGGWNANLPVGQAVRSIRLDIDAANADHIDDSLYDDDRLNPKPDDTPSLPDPWWHTK